MSFRTVKISKRCKLETQLNYLLCRAEDETRILLDEISLLIIENQQVCITQALLTELVKHKIRVVFCDETHNPISEVQPYASTYDSYGKIKTQIAWQEERKGKLWQKIVKNKIHNQALILKHSKHIDEYNSLIKFRDEVLVGDTTNREGLAAKMYFSTLFGNDFDRRDCKEIKNIYLNYGYSIILAAINREIAYFGYLSQIGIHHIGEQNPFNLGCDLMEPFRPFVDLLIVKNRINEDDFKSIFIKLPSTEIHIDDKTMYMENAMNMFILNALNYLKSDDDYNLPMVTFLDEQL